MNAALPVLLPRLLVSSLCLALVTVVLSAYLRLAESSIGCEPWPACYGQYHNNESVMGINVLVASSEENETASEASYVVER
ncbi:MAG: hypothetical protein DRQ47_04230, partial [Gammaproteobacteria bacterium]